MKNADKKEAWNKNQDRFHYLKKKSVNILLYVIPVFSPVYVCVYEFNFFNNWNYIVICVFKFLKLILISLSPTKLWILSC